MSQPTGFADLAGRTVGIWGVGVEGEAAARRLDALAGALVLVDDVGDDSRGIVATANGGLEQLFTCDVVLKSPGIPRRRDDVRALESAGITVTSALNLWMREHDLSKVMAVTGTKGKSTTTALVTFLLRSLGEEAFSAGNIGEPPYDPEFPPDGWTVVEVSSYQAVDLTVAPPWVVVTSLGADHLDWHGSLAQYHHDKLSLTRASGDHVTFLADDALLLTQREDIGGVVEVVHPHDDARELAQALGLLGEHNVRNVALALSVTARATGRDVSEIVRSARAHVDDFHSLPGRLTLVRTVGGVRFVDDGLATAPLPTVAALDVFATDVVALIVGGYDRGVDYAPLANALIARALPTTLVTMPDVGDRIAGAVAGRGAITITPAADMVAAVHAALTAVGGRGVVLLSPSAPSFGRYTNWRERSADFVGVVNELADVVDSP